MYTDNNLRIYSTAYFRYIIYLQVRDFLYLRGENAEETFFTSKGSSWSHSVGRELQKWPFLGMWTPQNPNMVYSDSVHSSIQYRKTGMGPFFLRHVAECFRCIFLFSLRDFSV